MKKNTIAIDFGSSRTKIAYYDSKKEKPELLELGKEIRNIIPSVFHLPEEGGEISVGDDAQDMIDKDPQGIILGLKTEIHKLGKKRCGVGRIKVSRIELASKLFEYIKDQCENEIFHNQKINSCVLTVPVCFEEQKRECIKKAAELAGFSEIELMEEPVAAAKHWLANHKGDVLDQIIICDVGGGTTDLAMLQFKNGKFISYPDIPPAGFSQGGNDVDEAVWEQIIEQNDVSDDSLLTKASGFILRIRKTKEILKKYIKNKIPITVAGDELNISKEIIEEVIEEFVERIQSETKRFLDKCEEVTGNKNIPILLVGGAARLIGLKEAMEELTDAEVYLWKDSDYATALGAIYQKTDKKETNINANLSAYKMALEMAWTDKKLSKEEWELLCDKQKEFNISIEGVEKIEKEVMGDTMINIITSQLEQKKRASKARRNISRKQSFSIKKLEKLVKENNPAGQYELGVKYITGAGELLCDEDKGLSLIKQSANNGFAKAQYFIALDDENFDIDKRKIYFNKAQKQNYPQKLADNNDKTAMLDLGLSYLPTFEFIESDIEQAYHWLEKADTISSLCFLLIYLISMIENAEYAEIANRIANTIISKNDEIDSGDDLSAMGMTYYFLEFYMPACKYFKKAIEKQCALKSSYYFLGLCYRALNESDKVLQYMRKAINSGSIEALEFMIDYKIINRLNTYFNNSNANDFYIGENIPDNKLKNASVAYGRNIDKCSYNVCALHDPTFFGGAKNGFMITTIGIMSHEYNSNIKNYIPWSSINNVIASKDSIIILCDKNKKILITCSEPSVLQIMEKYLIEIKNEIISDYKKLIDHHNKLKEKKFLKRNVKRIKTERQNNSNGKHQYNFKGICVKCGCSKEGFGAKRQCKGNPFDN